jgi:carbon storage regulator
MDFNPTSLQMSLDRAAPTLYSERSDSGGAPKAYPDRDYRATLPLARSSKHEVRGKGYTTMLVLSRKKNESIVIDNHIVITVVEIRGDKVRLGITAPKEVPVYRQEILNAIQGSKVNQPLVTEPPAITPTTSQTPTGSL